MKIKVIPLYATEFDSGFHAAICSVLNSGRVWDTGIYIYITSKEMLGADENKNGDKQISLDTLIREKVVADSRFSHIAIKDIEFEMGKTYIKDNS